MIEYRRVTVGDFLTDDEIKAAAALYATSDVRNFAKSCCAQIIKPNIDRINKALGQECDELFLAYAVEYAMMKAEKKQKPLI